MSDSSVPPVPEPPKTGLSPLVWVGIGCAGLVLMAMVAFSVVGYFVVGKAREVAEEMEDDPIATMSGLIAAANPEIELVEADSDARVVTFRNTRTGEELTFDYEDIEEGRFSFTSGDDTTRIDLDAGAGGDTGRMTITSKDGETTVYQAGASTRPRWVPLYPGTEAVGGYETDTPELHGGALTFETDDTVDNVVDFYTSELEADGFMIQNRTTTPNGAIVVATTEGEARSVTLTTSLENGKVSAMVNYTEKK